MSQQWGASSTLAAGTIYLRQYNEVLPTIVNSGGNTDFCSLQKTVLMKYLIKTIEVMMLGGSEVR